MIIEETLRFIKNTKRLYVQYNELKCSNIHLVIVFIFLSFFYVLCLSVVVFFYICVFM